MQTSRRRAFDGHLQSLSKWHEHQPDHPQLATRNPHHQNPPAIGNRKAPSVAEQDQPEAGVQTLVKAIYHLRVQDGAVEEVLDKSVWKALKAIQVQLQAGGGGQEKRLVQLELEVCTPPSCFCRNR